MNVKETSPTSTNKTLKGPRKTIAVSSVRPAASSRRRAPAELSAWIDKARRLPAVRSDLIERVKSEIAAGTYETPQKVQAAIERLIDEIG